MKRGLKLTALLLAMLLLFQSAAFATEQTGGISLYSLDDESYGVMQTGAVELAAVSDTVLGIGQISASGAQMCTIHYLPGWEDSELIATLDQGTFVTVYVGEYNGIVSSTWMKIAYNGQDGYVQTDYLTLCACGNVTELKEHANSCPERQYVEYFCDNSTAQEIYDNWAGYSDEQKEYALTYLSWGQQDKLNELNTLIKENVPLVDAELDKTVGENSITLNGSLPEGTILQFAETGEAKKEALAGKLDLSGFADGVMTYAFDIGLEYDGEEYQPKEKVQITLNGIGTEEAAASEDYMVEVYHFLDTAEAVEKALADGTAIALNVEGQAAQFADELAASGVENTVYYTLISSEDGDIAVDGTSITFETDSFSDYYIAAGNSEISYDVYAGNWYEPVFEFLWGENDYKQHNTKLYVQPDTKLTFYIDHREATSSVGDWSVTANNQLKLKNLPQDSHSCEVYVPSDTPMNTSAYTELRVLHGDSYYYIDIYVVDKAAVIAGGLKQFKIAITCLKDPQNGRPGEPGVNTRSFAVISLGAAGEDKAKNYIDEAKFVAASKQNYDGTNTIGVVDDDGVGTAVKAVLKLTDEDWNNYLLTFAKMDGVYTSDGKLASTIAQATLKKDYILVPYIIKMQTANGPSWNLDCYIKHKDYVTLSYDVNLPESLILTRVQTPDSVTGEKGFQPTIDSIKYKTGSSTVTVTQNTMLTLQNAAGDTYNYVFTGWNTKQDGSGTSYQPGNTNLTVNANMILYAQWARVGKLAITKTVKKQDATNTADPDLSREFTMTVTMKQPNGSTPLTGSFTYTVDNGAAQTLKLNANGVGTIKLKHGQTATIVNLPAGATYTVTETAVTDFSTAYSDNDGTATDGKGTIGADTTDTVTVTNTYTKLKTASLTIEKQVSGPSDASNPNFTFELQLTNANDVPLTGKYSATVGDVSKTLTFDANGKTVITLKNGQSAVITGIPVTSKYVVTEKNLPLGYSIEEASKDGTVTVNQTNKVTFTNTYETGSLAISKTVVGKNDTFTFTVRLEGVRENPSYSVNGEAAQTLALTNGEGTIQLTNGQTATITGLPKGTKYTVTETADDDYTTAVNGAAGYNAGGEIGTAEAKAAFVNTHKTNDLTITKRFSGCTPDAEEAHTFTVKDSSGKVVVEVAIKGADSVTISDLPIGIYTVTEAPAGAWRYTVTSDKTAGEVEVKADAKGEITFTNTLNKEQWIDGNAYAENNFKSGGVVRED